jgi:hypothetical protein
MRIRVGRRGALLVAVVTIASASLTACAGLGEAGSAATVGDVQIKNGALTSEVDAIQEQRGEAAGTPDSPLVVNVLQRLIVTELVDQAAAQQGTVVTQGQIDSARAALEAQVGGADALVAAFLDSGVPAGSMDRQIELSLQVQALGATLAPDADPQTQQVAVLQYVTGLALQEGVEVSPRFGTWDGAQLTLGPLPSDLAGAPADPLAELLPAP